MYQSFQKQSGGQAISLNSDTFAVVAQVLASGDQETLLSPEIRRSLSFYDLELGDELQPTENGLDQLASDRGLYIVCSGRVRILGTGSEAQPKIPVQLLGTGSVFGADCRFNLPLMYQAIAASAAQIAYIPATAIDSILHTRLAFRNWLQQQVFQRQTVLFLKTTTQLRTLPSSQLQELLPFIKPLPIATGQRLRSVLGEHSYCWVREGTIQSQSQDSPPRVGDGFGGESGIPDGWVAATDLWVYELPQSNWDAAMAIAPILAMQLFNRDALQGSPDNPTHAGRAPSFRALSTLHQNPARATASSVVIAPVVSNASTNLSQQTLDSPHSSESQADNVVAFPYPSQNYRRRSLWRRYPYIEQQSSSDCGAACLAMISRYWGKSLPVHTLREKANIGRAGASLKSLAKVAEDLGLHSRPVRASFGRMAEQVNPWIAHWQGDHYVVVYRVRRGSVLIADPASGKRTISQKEFEANWTNYALLLEPTERLFTVPSPKASLGRYINALQPYKPLILQVVLVSLLIQIFGLVTPLLTQIILDRVVVQKSLTSLNVFAIGLVLFSIWSICIVAVRQYLLSYLSNRLDLTLISGFISHTLMLPLKFFESRRVGDIITRVQENQKIQRFLVGRVVISFLDFLTGFVYLGLMLFYSPKLTLLVLAIIPPIVVLTIAATPLLQKVSREVFKETADQNSLLVELIGGISMLKSTAAEPEMRWQWEEHLTRQMNAQFRSQKLGIRLELLNGLINSIGSVALLWYGATLVIRGELTVGQLVAFNMMMGYIINPVISVTNLWDELQEVLISVERLDDVFDATPEESPQHLLMTLPYVEGNVRFERVTFRYNEDAERNTLQEISFEAKAGDTIAIVGSSGSGKTTLIKLLQGLYQPTNGRVLIDDHDVRHVSSTSLRSQIGVVPQDCYLFSGTILENIRLYRTNFTLEQVVEAAKLAEAHSFIQAMPLSYNTKVGERGSTLSGGQRQRIAIARALLGNPRILILDEATSSLDVESERRFQRNLTQISRDRTTFIIAHRLSTIRHASRILVLDRGILVEQGTHDDLMLSAGLYYYLVQQQLAL
ncbi:ABC-type bacteriocin/lantibiotic exporter with N-terminal double-glycine peptidase domain [Leptolyngbyaceae cyanobacterium JSC-12]|nr:ABC-type bacteriocin/lantibiotic exporter with N-terminal double-glycine peptidase domain [Leptolyngbyaceae cyanobacterium JSC-12]